MLNNQNNSINHLIEELESKSFNLVLTSLSDDPVEMRKAFIESEEALKALWNAYNREINRRAVNSEDQENLKGLGKYGNQSQKAAFKNKEKLRPAPEDSNELPGFESLTNYIKNKPITNLPKEQQEVIRQYARTLDNLENALCETDKNIIAQGIESKAKIDEAKKAEKDIDNNDLRNVIEAVKVRDQRDKYATALNKCNENNAKTVWANVPAAYLLKVEAFLKSLEEISNQHFKDYINNTRKWLCRIFLARIQCFITYGHDDTLWAELFNQNDKLKLKPRKSRVSASLIEQMKDYIDDYGSLADKDELDKLKIIEPTCVTNLTAETANETTEYDFELISTENNTSSYSITTQNSDNQLLSFSISIDSGSIIINKSVQNSDKEEQEKTVYNWEESFVELNRESTTIQEECTLDTFSVKEKSNSIIVIHPANKPAVAQDTNNSEQSVTSNNGRIRKSNNSNFVSVDVDSSQKQKSVARRSSCTFFKPKPIVSAMGGLGIGIGVGVGIGLLLNPPIFLAVLAGGAAAVAAACFIYTAIGLGQLAQNQIKKQPKLATVRLAPK